MKKTLTTLLTVIAIATPVFAGTSSATLGISVQVVARTILSVDSQPSSVQITADDIARGYVDLPQSVLFRVRSNAANGYTVQFEPVSYPFNRADVSWGTMTATVGSDGAWMTQGYQQGTQTGTLNVRLSLAPGTQPGSYAWPVRFDAGSL
ncbi:MAG TPA: hypothetical protein VKU62_02960 [Thermoanaerobaculia bacterium]|nr:hypothetical protein [Thermoanaerobaculia bacterium]